MFKTLLLAVDLNDAPHSTRPTEAAIGFMTDPDATLHVVNVVPDFGMSIVGGFFNEGHAKQAMAEANKAMNSWAAEAFPGNLSPHLHVVQGTIYDQILKTAKSISADAIVIGAHRPGLQDYLVGPNAARVVRHATQSVFVIR